MNRKMKELFCIIAIFLMLGQGALGDCVFDHGKKTEGKIKFVASGLILLDSGREDKIYKREVSDDYFDDTIFYKTKLFKPDVEKISCRIKKSTKPT